MAVMRAATALALLALLGVARAGTARRRCAKGRSGDAPLTRSHATPRGAHVHGTAQPTRTPCTRTIRSTRCGARHPPPCRSWPPRTPPATASGAPVRAAASRGRECTCLNRGSCRRDVLGLPPCNRAGEACGINGVANLGTCETIASAVPEMPFCGCACCGRPSPGATRPQRVALINGRTRACLAWGGPWSSNSQGLVLDERLAGGVRQGRRAQQHRLGGGADLRQLRPDAARH